MLKNKQVTNDQNSTPPPKNNTTSKLNFFKSRKALLSASAIATLATSTGVAVAAGVAKISPQQIDYAASYPIGSTFSFHDEATPSTPESIHNMLGVGTWVFKETDAAITVEADWSYNSSKVAPYNGKCRFRVSNHKFTFLGGSSSGYVDVGDIGRFISVTSLPTSFIFPNNDNINTTNFNPSFSSIAWQTESGTVTGTGRLCNYSGYIYIDMYAVNKGTVPFSSTYLYYSNNNFVDDETKQFILKPQANATNTWIRTQ